MTERISKLYKSLYMTGKWDSQIEEIIKDIIKEALSEGYKKGKEEQQTIKPLEFNKGVAVSPFGDYHIAFDNEDLIFEVWQNGEIIDTCKTVEEAINYCNKDYLEKVKSCLISEHGNETES